MRPLHSVTLSSHHYSVRFTFIHEPETGYHPLTRFAFYDGFRVTYRHNLDLLSGSNF
jgi:hypothetical protein